MRTLIANSSLVTELVVGCCPHQRDGQQDGGAAWATDFLFPLQSLVPMCLGSITSTGRSRKGGVGPPDPCPGAVTHSCNLFPAGKPFSLCNTWQGRLSQLVASELNLH